MSDDNNSVNFSINIFGTPAKVAEALGLISFSGVKTLNFTATVGQVAPAPETGRAMMRRAFGEADLGQPDPSVSLRDLTERSTTESSIAGRKVVVKMLRKTGKKPAKKAVTAKKRGK